MKLPDNIPDQNSKAWYLYESIGTKTKQLVRQTLVSFFLDCLYFKLSSVVNLRWGYL